MHIGVNTLFLIPGEVGGSETYVCETIAQWVRNDPDLHLTLFTNLENDDWLRERFGSAATVSFELIRVRAQNRYLRIIREQVELPLRAARASVELLWSPGYTAPVVSSVPQVVSLLDMQYRRFPEDLGWVARQVTGLLVRCAVRRARLLFAISEFSKQEIIRFTRARPEMIEVTRLAADPRFAQDQGLEASEVLRSEELVAEPYLLCVANTYPHKNVAVLIRAFDLLGGAFPHHLVLVGKPRRGEASVQEALQCCRCRDRIHRIGHLDRRSLIALYQGCAVFVFPSLYEGFGLPVLEAMLAGVPVVTADIPACREIGADHIVTCDATDPEALALTIREVLGETSERRDERMAAARAWAMRFRWSETARLTRTGFERVLRQRDAQ